MSVLTTTVELAGGVRVPRLGLGVFQVAADEAQRVVEEALDVGYRHVDTAAAYVNESGVGAAVRASGLRREDVFVTSKLRNGDQGHDATLRAYDETLERSGLDFLDLYLVHWPNPEAGLWQDSWRAMERLLAEGRVRAIGVSNFLGEHLAELADLASVTPAVNQVELHPRFQQADLVADCRERGIVIEAYSPLGQGGALGADAVKELARALGRTPAQVVLRWHLQRGHVVIPKTTSVTRMRENADVDGFQLDAEQLAHLDALESGERIGNDPRTFALSQIR